MSKHSRYLKLLEVINNIDENNSDVSEGKLSESEEEHDDSFDSTDEWEISDKGNDGENILNIHRGQKRKRPSSSSESKIAADVTLWQEMEQNPTPEQPSIHNIFSEVAGPTAYVKRNIIKGKVRTAFSLLIDKHVTEHIRKCTEEEASRVLGTEWILTPEKINAFIAILYARGAYQANKLNISYLWNKKWGPAFFSKTMSRNDFCEIMRFIRFDKKSQRSQRLQTDKFALISKVWYKFIVNSQKCYKPGEHITIDEQLFPTKARCRFIQYMPNKPDKFGIKFWLASDVSTKYIINGFPYLGEDEDREACPCPLDEFVGLKLLNPFTGCGRIVTTNNFFTSASLTEKLLKKKTTIVGTIRGNKRELPNDMTDQMLRKYSVKSKSLRWPVQIFFNILDLAGINSWVLYRETTGEKISRKQFLFQLAEELAEDFQHEQREGKEITSITSTNSCSDSSVQIRKRCQIGYCKANKTTKICYKCNKHVCGKCVFENPIICKICGEH